MYGKKHWTEAELRVAMKYAVQVRQGDLSYYRAMKLCHSDIPARSEAACREAIRSFVTGRRNFDDYH